jgi:hypothetical protein
LNSSNVERELNTSFTIPLPVKCNAIEETTSTVEYVYMLKVSPKKSPSPSFNSTHNHIYRALP